MGPPPGVGIATRLPSWLGSIRVRIAVLYSVVLFALAGMGLGAVYVGLWRSLDDQPITRRVGGVSVLMPDGTIERFDIERLDAYLYIEREANARALETLQQYSFVALVLLFVASLVVGWLVSGRVLAPIGRITRVAREIQANDLSRRIDLRGPDDELHRLAGTFDGMLDRIDDAFEAQRQFIHEASHELRNPLAVIRTNLDVALADPDATAEDLRRTAEVVHKSTDRMGRLVDDLLVYARRGHLSPQLESVRVDELVAEAVDEFALTAEHRGVKLDWEAPEDLELPGDRLALRQALANLLANALRVSPPGTTTRVRAGRHDPWVWISVEDEGPGIAPEDQERVFQRFWRGDAATVQGPVGGDGDPARVRSGLGLTIVRQIAEAHGGSVRLVSEPGRGATFAIWLPLAGPPATVTDRHESR